ncbi:MAG: type II toxin-antitoxin system VapC family toxin [Acidimicrobiia bacterium]|nr:type II toxin-antitoxin system VapC family toxin [Acidimicrobiia bacterium]MYC57245.1 type II toxin-antitoxin system VapC family toxin [Acidimicrobiia bacterium]MYI30695.1 type II toxin-antitoxin system VapC family toxin [Acidimicrobiia bacterium]
MYVLDTNIVSEIRKTKVGKADPAVGKWANQVPVELTYISTVTIQELEHGVLLAERRDPKLGAILRNWLDGDVVTAFKQRILPVDASVARLAASLHVPDQAPIIDALIAATALANGMTVVTLNACDFERFEQIQVLRLR